MYHFIATFATVFWALVFHHVDAEAVVTPAPISPEQGSLVKYGKIQERDEYLDYCYGTGNFCDLSLPLFRQCDKYLNLPSMSQWYMCLCGNGYMATGRACGWCDLAYKQPDAFPEDLYTSECSSIHVTIAPIPSSILSAASCFNASFSGNAATTGCSPISSWPAPPMTRPTAYPTGPIASGGSVIRPSQGETINAGDLYTIIWSAPPVQGPVDIELWGAGNTVPWTNVSCDGWIFNERCVKIERNSPSGSTSYEWSVPYADTILADKDESFRLGVYIGGLDSGQMPNQDSPWYISGATFTINFAGTRSPTITGDSSFPPSTPTSTATTTGTGAGTGTGTGMGTTTGTGTSTSSATRNAPAASSGAAVPPRLGKHNLGLGAVGLAGAFLLL